MRSRSTRLFVVLVHLVGVSTHLPHVSRGGSDDDEYENDHGDCSGGNGHGDSANGGWDDRDRPRRRQGRRASSSTRSSRPQARYPGIVGVNPAAIMLETLDLSPYGKDGLDGLLRHASMQWNGGDDLILNEPYWLQDDTDGKCLGPMGFSECGDATLWLIRRHRRLRRRGRGRRHRRKPHKKNGAVRVSAGEARTAPSSSSGTTTTTTASVSRDGGLGGRNRPSRDDSSSSRRVTTVDCLFFCNQFSKVDQEEDDDDDTGYALQLVDAEMMRDLHEQQFRRIKNDDDDDSGDAAPSRSERRPRGRRKRDAIEDDDDAEDDWNRDDDDEDDGKHECLSVVGRRRRRRRARRRKTPIGMDTASCARDFVWSWRINGDGNLYHDDWENRDMGGPIHEIEGVKRARAAAAADVVVVVESLDTGRPKRRGLPSTTSHERHQHHHHCLWRNGTSGIFLSACDPSSHDGEEVAPSNASGTGIDLGGEITNDAALRMVNLTLIRFQMATTIPGTVGVIGDGKNNENRTDISGLLRLLHDEMMRTEFAARLPSPATTSLSALTADPSMDVSNQKPQEPRHLLTTRDLAHSHASLPSGSPLSSSPPLGGGKKKVALKSSPSATVASSTATPTVSKNSMAGARIQSSKKPAPTALTSLKDPNPILFVADEDVEDELVQTPPSSTTTSKTRGKPLVASASARGMGPSSSSSSSSRQTPPSLSAAVAATSKNRDPAAYKKARIQTHPYLATAKNDVWKDPATGLEYRTDLCQYLGHTRKEAGRHTLMGVGQYMRTMFNIKVYGIALYVSKRDALADPVMKKFAHMTVEELRQRPDFYSHLRHMPSPLDAHAGWMDRTLLLQLNMQLSVDTMRSSLEADWKLLTGERKALLIDSSMKPRPAEEPMLRKIAGKGGTSNPGRCSCGQVAPPEYSADSTCCARGTELAFTWRKNGNLEVRVDGRIMDIFPRPDVAQGIFFEYLRYDDPIAVDFREHAVDGFPFLLAPLAQVDAANDFLHHHQQQQHHHQANQSHNDRGGGLGRAVGTMAGMLSSQAGEVAGWVQGNVNGAVSTVAKSAKVVGDTARGFGQEMERRRDQLWNHVSSGLPPLPQPLSGIANHLPKTRRRPDALAVSVSTWLNRQHNGLYSSNLEQGQQQPQHQAPHYYPRRPIGPRGRIFRSSPLIRWLSDSAAMENDESGGGGSPPPIADEIGPMILPTENLTRRIFLAMVHFYLLLLLIVSLPGSHSTKIVFRKAFTTSPTKNTTEDEAVCGEKVSDTDTDDDDDESSVADEDEKPGEGMPLSTAAVAAAVAAAAVWPSSREKRPPNITDKEKCKKSVRSRRARPRLFSARNANDRVFSKRKVEGGKEKETSRPDAAPKKNLKKALSYFL